MDDQRPQRSWAHWLPARRHCGKRRNLVPDAQCRCRRSPESRSRLGWQGVGCMIPTSKGNPTTWKWTVCGMLLLATMLNYMDRQTLSVTASRLMRELEINEAQYGLLERYFGYAFAFGGLFFGILADRMRIYYLYPF